MSRKLIELEIEGMTCTACARRVERNLNKLEGVTAYVDFATEKAHVEFDGETAVLESAVEAAGYKVGKGKPELALLRPRLFVGGLLSALAVAFSMVPELMFGGHQCFSMWRFRFTMLH
jgi:Cu+-exporting ATPase